MNSQIQVEIWRLQAYLNQNPTVASIIAVKYKVETEREQTTSNFKIDVPCSCGHCESDQYYQCKGCLRVCAYCFGGSDKFEDYCDYCYHELDNDLVTVLVR